MVTDIRNKDTLSIYYITYLPTPFLKNPNSTFITISYFIKVHAQIFKRVFTPWHGRLCEQVWPFHHVSAIGQNLSRFYLHAMFNIVVAIGGTFCMQCLTC